MRKILLFTILLLVFASFTSGVCDPLYLKSHTVAYYPFEENALDYEDVVNTIDFKWATNIPERITGKIDFGQDFDKPSNEIIWSENSTKFQNAKFTINFWINISSNLVWHKPINLFWDDGVHAYGWDISIRNSGVMQFFVYKGFGYNSDRWDTPAMKAQEAIMVTAQFNGSDTAVYFNNTLTGAEAIEAVNNVVYNPGKMGLMVGESCTNAGCQARQLDGMMDEIAIFDIDLNATCRAYLYNSSTPGLHQQYNYSGIPIPPPPPPSWDLSLNLSYPINNTHYNYNSANTSRIYNGSVLLTSTNISNCTINNSLWAVNQTGAYTHHFLNTTANVSIPIGNYSIEVECSNPFNTTNMTFWFVIDTNDPTITTNIVNGTTYSAQFDINVSYYDSYLFRANTTLVYDSTGVVYLNNFSGDLTGYNETYNVSMFVNASIDTFLLGNYTLIMEASDTHTNNKYFDEKEVKVKKTKVGNDYMYEYGFGKHKIKFYLDEKIDLKYQKKSDRLTFQYESNHRGETYKIIEAEHNIVYLPNSPYKYHFIIDDKLWYDHEGLDVTRWERIGNNVIKIYYIQNKYKEESQSLGGLNEFSRNLSIRILPGATGNITIGTIFNPPLANFTYNISVNFTADIVYINETCLFVVNSTPDYDGTYCYDINSHNLEDIIVFYSATPLGCLANITNVVGEAIPVNYEWLNRTSGVIRSGSTTCEHNALCIVDTLPANLALFNDTLSCTIEVERTFFVSNTSTSNLLNTSSIGVCDGVNIFPLINITYRDEVTGNIVNVTNAYDIQFYDGLGYFNLTGSFTGNSSDKYCTDVNNSVTTVNLDLLGSFTLSAPTYVTRILSLPLVEAIPVSNNPYTNTTFLMITIANSSTITYTWQTTEFQFITGTMIINRCDANGTKTLVEATPITAGLAVANLQLFTTPYSYSVVIDGVSYIDDSFTTCHIESVTEREFFVDVSALNILPAIGLFLVDCHLTKVADNIVKMYWSGNIEDTSAITGCIVGRRRTVLGLEEMYRNCTVGVTGNFVRTIPDNGNAYYVNGEITQNSITGFCQETVAFFDETDASKIFGATGLLGVVLLIISLGLIYAGEGEKQLIGAGIGLLVAFGLSILSLSWELVLMGIMFLTVIAIIGRYTRRRQEIG